MLWPELMGPTLAELQQDPNARTLLLLAGSALAGLAVYALLARLSLWLARRSLRGRIIAFLAGSEDTFEALGNSLLRRMPRDRSRQWTGMLQRYQQWIELDGGTMSPGRLLGITVASLGLGILGGLNQIPLLAVVAILGAVYPFVRLRARVRQIRRRIERALPELLSLMAAEMAAGTPAAGALERAGTFGGPLSVLIRQALQESQASRRPMFGRRNAPGVWREVVERYDLSALRAFALQIEIAARKGAAGPELMESLSRSLILSYREQALREAEKIENRLAVPSVLFFFLPLMALVLTPLLLPLLASLTG